LRQVLTIREGAETLWEAAWETDDPTKWAAVKATCMFKCTDCKEGGQFNCADYTAAAGFIGVMTGVDVSATDTSSNAIELSITDAPPGWS
jgi:hypothetical protein